LLARAFAPLDPADLVPLLDVPWTETAEGLEMYRSFVDPVITWHEGYTSMRFRHEALRAAWERISEERMTSVTHAFAEGGRRCLPDWTPKEIPNDAPLGYFRRYAGDHLVEVGAPHVELLMLVEPRWAFPSSREDLAARRMELGRLRRA